VTWTVCSYTVADISTQTTGSNDPDHSAGRVLENLAELEPELVAAAIIDADGETIASTGAGQGPGTAWAAAAIELLGALADVRDTAVDSAHLATDDAEVFVVRENGLSLVAVTGRFVLASLTSFDMRMALRDAASGAGNA